MSWGLVALCGLAYAWVSATLFKGDPWMALVYAGYAAANVGLVMKLLGK
jgi:hypothetical protein